jgi:hypothetical protein
VRLSSDPGDMSSAHDRTLTTPSLSIVYQFVSRILNERSLPHVALLMSERYRDNDPLIIPGYLMPRKPGAGTVREVETLVRYLDQPKVDLFFTIEEAFGAGDSVAVRIFGEGTAAKWQPSSSWRGNALRSERLSDVSGVAGSSDQDELMEPTSSSMQHLLMDTTQIIHVEGGRILEKWGAWRIRTVDI